MRKSYDRFVDVLQVLSAVLLLLMLGIVVVGIFYRYVVDEALSWYDEFAGYILIWLTMYGSVLALAKRKLSFTVLKQAIEATATMTSFVMFILVGSTVFSLVFRGMDGDLWVEHLLTSVPGGALGFLIVVNEGAQPVPVATGKAEEEDDE